MRLPNGTQAVVETAKLVDYCLSPHHPRGKHKARVFGSVLGITDANATFLQEALLQAAATSENVEPSEEDRYGQRYVLDFEMRGPGGAAIIRSVWIVRTGESIPRLTTCYVLD